MSELQLGKKISVIVPVYKTEQYIRQCIDSLLDQDYPEYEIILIDDGSPDNCGQICDGYAQKHNIISVVHQKNAGVSAARNAGLHIAKGDYVTFVDSDDWVDPDYLLILARYMRAGGMSVCGMKRVSASGHKKTSRREKSEEDQVISMDQIEAEKSVLRWDGICGYTCAKLFDRQIIEQYKLAFREDIVFMEDQLFTIQYLSYTRDTTILNGRKVYYYRINPKSSTSQTLIRKYSEFRPEIFSECVARTEMEKYISQSSDLISLMKARQINTKRTALLIMEVNNWKDMECWKTYLSDLRLGIFQYLQCDTGDPIEERIKIILCAINPRLAWSCITVWEFIKKILRTCYYF